MRSRLTRLRARGRVRTVTALTAELYASTHRGNDGDVAFYAKACRNTASVLELGTGYGRLLPALSRVSNAVVGLELDPSLLSVAARTIRTLPRVQRDRVTLLRGDMQDFDVRRRFDRILLPYNALYCLVSRQAIIRCFRNVRAHLEPGGLFIADVWSADAFHRAANRRDNRDDAGPIISFSRGKETWDVFERSRLRRREQRLDVTYTYASRERGRTLAISIAQRYLRSRELPELLSRSGLELASVHGDFVGHPYSPRSEHLVFTARSSSSAKPL